MGALSKKDVLELLISAGVSHTVQEHAPVMTAEAQARTAVIRRPYSTAHWQVINIFLTFAGS